MCSARGRPVTQQSRPVSGACLLQVVSLLLAAPQILILAPHTPVTTLQVRCGWGLSPGQESMLTSAVFLGTMLGVSSWGAIADGLGRRRGFAATALFIFAFGILSALSPNYVVRSSVINLRTAAMTTAAPSTWVGRSVISNYGSDST